jgi:predicted GTPase
LLHLNLNVDNNASTASHEWFGPGRKLGSENMAIKLKSTRGLHAQGVKLLVYGQAGAGKTSLIKTLPDPGGLIR